jgi:DNA-binding IclR family transcriptional regulator
MTRSLDKSQETEKVDKKGGRYNVRAVDRALCILSVLSDGKPRTLTELSEEIGINSSSVERDKGSAKYRLGLACLELARAYHAGSDIRQAALPELEQLRDDTTETVHLGVLDSTEVVYIEKLHGLHAVGLMSSQVGGRSPGYCTGLGKALLAHTDPQLVRARYEKTGLHRYNDSTIQSLDELLEHLDKVRVQGYALDRGEHEVEVRCVAAPVFGMTGKAVAAISVSGPAARIEPVEANHELISRTMQAAHIISTRLGYRETYHDTHNPQQTRQGPSQMKV